MRYKHDHAGYEIVSGTLSHRECAALLDRLSSPAARAAHRIRGLTADRAGHLARAGVKASQRP